jgi:hypothetical protein
MIILGTLAIFPLVGYQIARQGIRPVEEMAATARRISSTHLGERILTEGYPFELAWKASRSPTASMPRFPGVYPIASFHPTLISSQLTGSAVT